MASIHKVVHLLHRDRAGARHRNADALSRRPTGDNEDEGQGLERCAKATVAQATHETKTEDEDQVPASAGETMAELQQRDPDI